MPVGRGPVVRAQATSRPLLCLAAPERSSSSIRTRTALRVGLEGVAREVGRPRAGGEVVGRLCQPIADHQSVGCDPPAGVPGGRLGPLQPPLVALPGGVQCSLRLDDGRAVARAGPACFKAGQPLDALHGPPYRARALAVGVDPGHVVGVGGVAQDQYPLLGLPQGEVAQGVPRGVWTSSRTPPASIWSPSESQTSTR